jgi:hypothetical protein
MSGLGIFVTKSYDKTPVKQGGKKMAAGKPKPKASSLKRPMSKPKPKPNKAFDSYVENETYSANGGGTRRTFARSQAKSGNKDYTTLRENGMKATVAGSNKGVSVTVGKTTVNKPARSSYRKAIGEAKTAEMRNLVKKKEAMQQKVNAVRGRNSAVRAAGAKRGK